MKYNFSFFWPAFLFSLLIASAVSFFVVFNNYILDTCSYLSFFSSFVKVINGPMYRQHNKKKYVVKS